MIGGMVTVMNAEGKPVQVPAGALQAANVQNHIGKIYDSKTIKLCVRSNWLTKSVLSSLYSQL